MSERVRTKLRELGASDEEIDRAIREDRLTLLLLERMLLPHDQMYTAQDVVAEVGIDRELSDRLWRAMGFPDAAEDERAFTEFDILALREMIGLFQVPGREFELGVQLTRVVSLAALRSPGWPRRRGTPSRR
jgi:adenylate cyclase